MRNTKMGRYALLGSVAALGLMCAGAAQAYETKFGDFEVVLDTTVSAGVSMRVADRNTDFLPEVNGGSLIDGRVPYNFNAGTCNQPAPGVFVPGGAGYGTCAIANSLGIVGNISLNSLPSPSNRAGSINGDDGRLNFDSGDLTGATFKVSNDLQIKWQNFTLFGRWFAFYDAVLDDKNVGDRSSFSDEVQGTVGRDAQLLDLFISGNFDLFGESLNVRLGKQVISWGEGTFIQNGINVINPIDVSAFRRPGAEIKEGLIPVNSIFASVSLPIEGMSLSGFYMLDFEPFQIDAAGTPFSGADTLDASNLDPRGSINSFLSGGKYSGSFRRNCSAAGSGSRQVSYGIGLAVGAAYDAKIRAACGTSAFVNHDAAIPIGQGEFVKNTTFDGPDTLANAPYRNGDQAIVDRLGNNEAESSDQYGLRMNYYSQDLGTEFGFYYMNYHSRLPFVSFRSNSPRVQISTTSPSSSATGRGTLTQGCVQNAIQNVGGAAGPGYLATLIGGAGNPLVTPSANSSFYLGGSVEETLNRQTTIEDVNDYEGTMAAVAAAVATGLGYAPEALSILTAAGTSGTGRADLHNLNRINCLLLAANSSITGVSPAPLLHDGAEILGITNDMSIFLDYPEDIQLFGFSFNTTVWGWGVQFETSYRPDAPFQLDTDQLTIASALAQCAGATVGSMGGLFQALNTLKQYNCPYNDDLTQTAAQKAAAGIRVGEQNLPGYIYNEMFTAQIGTTATFTASEWWVETLGADGAVLVTELGMVHVPDVEKTYINDLASPTLAGPQYQNTGCQGSDLGLGGFLDLSVASSRSCRPTSTSAGYVLLGRMTYNNAFNTGYVLSPTFSFSHDFYGTTPSPYGNYLQDRMSGSLSMQAELNNNFRLNLGYTNFWGGHLNNKAQDQDFVSFSAQYSF